MRGGLQAKGFNEKANPRRVRLFCARLFFMSGAILARSRQLPERSDLIGIDGKLLLSEASRALQSGLCDSDLSDSKHGTEVTVALFIVECSQKIRNRKHGLPKTTVLGRNPRCFQKKRSTGPGIYRQTRRRQLGRRQVHLRFRETDEHTLDGRFVASNNMATTGRRRRP